MGKEVAITRSSKLKGSVPLKIELQRRDLMMMKFIYMFGAATYDQIRQKFFMGRHPSAATGRIRALRKAGYLQPFWYVKDERSQRCVKLREKSASVIEYLWKEKIDDPSFEIESLGRALCMTELAIRFERLKIFDRMLSPRIIGGSSVMSKQVSYRVLRWQTPDGVLELKKEGQKFRFPIELEFGTKTREHYERKLRGYYGDGAIDGIFFLCAHNQTMDVIAQVDADVRRDQKSIVYLALSSSVLQAPGQLSFTSCTGTRIGLE
jgi:hypothetical protein